jgi:hypothetical protein
VAVQLVGCVSCGVLHSVITDATCCLRDTRPWPLHFVSTSPALLTLAAGLLHVSIHPHPTPRLSVLPLPPSLTFLSSKNNSRDLLTSRLRVSSAQRPNATVQQLLHVLFAVVCATSAGGLQYPHRSPASRKRRQKGNPVPGGITGPPCFGGI